MAIATSPLAEAEAGVLVDLKGETSSSSSRSSSPSPSNEYETFDLDKEREIQGASFDEKVTILKASPALAELLQNYSVAPNDDLERLAASLSVQQAKSFIDAIDGKKFIVTPGEDEEFQVVDDNGIRARAAGDKCWKGYVGIAAYTTVTGFYCGLTAPFAAPCGIGAAIAADNVDWHRHC